MSAKQEISENHFQSLWFGLIRKLLLSLQGAKHTPQLPHKGACRRGKNLCREEGYELFSNSCSATKWAFLTITIALSWVKPRNINAILLFVETYYDNFFACLHGLLQK